MSTTVVRAPESVEGDVDATPTAHIPDEEGVRLIREGLSPRRAICGADLLGVLATPPFKTCATCWEMLWGEPGWRN